MVPEILELVLMPLDLFVELVYLNPYFFVDAAIILIVLNAVYRFLLAPILGNHLGEAGSDYVARKNFERNRRFKKGG